MKRRMPVALSVIAFCIAMLAGCSVGPAEVADGGTHTGNPDVSACASALFDIMATGDEWHVESYIDSLQLDPAYIEPDSSSDLAEPYANVLAKRRALAAFAVVETVLIYDTLYVNDTVVNQYIKADTIDTVVGVDTLMYVNTWLVSDTLIAIDTVILVDTLIVTDTMDAATTKADTATGADSISGAANEGLDYTVLPDSTRNSYKAAPPGANDAAQKFTVIPDALKSVMSRSGLYSTPSGVTVFVEYSDADGDNLLFKAAAGAVPLALLRESRLAGAVKLFLNAKFSAGNDSDFLARADNTVYSLLRYRIDGDDTTETVSYATPLSAQVAADSVVLTLGERSPSDTVYSRTTRFSVAAGANTQSAVDDKLAGLAQTLFYRRGDIDKITLSVIPSSPVSKGRALGVSTFSAVIISAAGDTTRMQGTVDPQSGISATYTDSISTSNLTVSPAGVMEFGTP